MIGKTSNLRDYQNPNVDLDYKSIYFFLYKQLRMYL